MLKSNQKTILESLVSGSPVKDPEKLLQVPVPQSKILSFQV
jgi:hypothetical protein